MTTKRKLEQHYNDDLGSISTRLKSVNLGGTVDPARKTQMLLQFGQLLQLQRVRGSKNQDNNPLPSDSCLQCTTARSGPDAGMRCHHCSKLQCEKCLLQCYCCNNTFCSTCSIFDYGEYETRSVCFDCSR